MKILKNTLKRETTEYGNLRISFETRDFRETDKFTAFGDKDLQAIIEPVKVRRSLNANAYSWVLTEKLANAMRIDKEECHRMMLARYGQTAEDKEGHPIVFSAYIGIPEREIMRAGIYVAPLSQHSFIGEKEFVHYRVLKGSKELNSHEFSIYLDGLIQECKDLGIEVLPPSEIRRMKQLYGVEE